MVKADVFTVKVTCSPSCWLDYYLMDGKGPDGVNQHTDRQTVRRVFSSDDHQIHSTGGTVQTEVSSKLNFSYIRKIIMLYKEYVRIYPGKLNLFYINCFLEYKTV